MNGLGTWLIFMVRKSKSTGLNVVTYKLCVLLLIPRIKNDSNLPIDKTYIITSKALRYIELDFYFFLLES